MIAIEQGFIKLEDIYGVDLFSKSTPLVKSHPDLKNPKTELRERIVNNIYNAIKEGKVAERDIPPIEVVFSKEDNKWVVVDGYHRLEAIVRYRSKERNSMRFDKIRAVEFKGKLSDAQLYAFRVNVQEDDTRQGLTDSEIFTFCADFIIENPKKENYFYVDKLGVSERVLRVVQNVLTKGIDEVQKALVNGELSLDTASKIVNSSKGSKLEQRKKTEKIVEAKKQGKSEKEARVEAGAQKKRQETVRTKHDLLQELQDTIKSTLEDSTSEEDFIYNCGKAEGISFALSLDKKNEEFVYIESEDTLRELLKVVNAELDS